MELMDSSICQELSGQRKAGNFKNCTGMFSVILEIYSPDGIKTIRKKEKVKGFLVRKVKEELIVGKAGPEP